MKLFKKIKLTNSIHIFLGILAFMLFIKGYGVLLILLCVTYSIYQLLNYLTKEELKETFKDFQEFIVGIILALCYYSLHVLGVPLPFV